MSNSIFFYLILMQFSVKCLFLWVTFEPTQKMNLLCYGKEATRDPNSEIYHIWKIHKKLFSIWCWHVWSMCFYLELIVELFSIIFLIASLPMFCFSIKFHIPTNVVKKAKQEECPNYNGSSKLLSPAYCCL